MADQFRSTPAFLIHVPCHPFGTDPSQTVKAFGQPTPTRETATQTWIPRGRGRAFNGRLTGAATGATAQITCTLINVEPGRHRIRVGNVELRPGIDFALGASDADLATNLAAAINGLTGFVAPAPGANIVQITTSQGTASDIPISVVETSAVTAFVLGGAEDGLMDAGAPAPTAPLIA